MLALKVTINFSGAIVLIFEKKKILKWKYLHLIILSLDSKFPNHLIYLKNLHYHLSSVKNSKTISSVFSLICLIFLISQCPESPQSTQPLNPCIFHTSLISPAPFFCFQCLGLQSQDIGLDLAEGSQRFELVEIFGKVDLSQS